VFAYSDSGLTANFTNLSVNAGTWSWDFGDGFFASTQNASHTYTTPNTYTVCLTAASACSSDTLCNAVTVLQTGIKETADKTGMEVYPNPTAGLLNIYLPMQVNTGITITLYNLLGEVVFYADVNELKAVNKTANFTMYAIDLHKIAGGAYLLKVQTSDRVFMDKVLLNK
ncbi:MAG: PKD domain-containing protein, partial [Bacteroidota bacterium]